ncbi:MAG: amidase family protein, partial [Vicinamibacterales bacterium]
GIEGLQIAWLVDDGRGDVESEIQVGVERGVATLVAAGARVSELALPLINELVWDVLPTIEQAETAADYEGWLRERPAEFSSIFREFAEAGLRTTAAELTRARRLMQHGLHQVERALRDYDLLVSPTLSIFPPPAGVDDIELVRFTALWDNNGWPAISVPVGLAANGLPIGFQIAGKPWQEALVLRAARVIERQHGLTFPAGKRGEGAKNV